MKKMMLGAVCALAFGFAGSAMADDLVAQCKANAEAEGGDVAAMETFCGCLVETAGGDEAVLGQLNEIAQAPAEERTEKYEAEATDETRAVVDACEPPAAAGEDAAAAE